MRVTIELPGAKAFSVNKMFTRDMRFKSGEFKDWYIRLKTKIEELDEYKRLMELAADVQNTSQASLSIYIECVYPVWLFYNKQGEISSKVFDISNVEKPLIDLLVQDIMGLNDKLITYMESSKRAGANYALNITLELNTN